MRADAARSRRGWFFAEWLTISGCGVTLQVRGAFGSATEFRDGNGGRMGHRRKGRHRLGCCSRQDVQCVQSKLVR